MGASLSRSVGGGNAAHELPAGVTRVVVKGALSDVCLTEDGGELVVAAGGYVSFVSLGKGGAAEDSAMPGSVRALGVCAWRGRSAVVAASDGAAYLVAPGAATVRLWAPPSPHDRLLDLAATPSFAYGMYPGGCLLRVAATKPDAADREPADTLAIDPAATELWPIDPTGGSDGVACGRAGFACSVFGAPEVAVGRRCTAAVLDWQGRAVTASFRDGVVRREGYGGAQTLGWRVERLAATSDGFIVAWSAGPARRVAVLDDRLGVRFQRSLPPGTVTSVCGRSGTACFALPGGGSSVEVWLLAEALGISEPPAVSGAARRPPPRRGPRPVHGRGVLPLGGHVSFERPVFDPERLNAGGGGPPEPEAGALRGARVDGSVLYTGRPPPPPDHAAPGSSTDLSDSPLTFSDLRPFARVLLLPVADEGQQLDLQGMARALRPRTIDVAEAYFREASGGRMDVELCLFGGDSRFRLPPHDMRRPLVLPKQLTEYIAKPAREPALRVPLGSRAGLDASHMSGRERVRLLLTSPSAGSATVELRFAAAYSILRLGPFPVRFDFDGNEALTLDVTTAGGEVVRLTLRFTAASLVAESVDDARDFTAALGAHVTAAVRAAEAAAGLGEPLLADLVYTRLSTGSDFGAMYGEWGLHAGGGAVPPAWHEPRVRVVTAAGGAPDPLPRVDVRQLAMPAVCTGLGYHSLVVRIAARAATGAGAAGEPRPDLTVRFSQTEPDVAYVAPDDVGDAIAQHDAVYIVPNGDWVPAGVEGEPLWPAASDTGLLWNSTELLPPVAATTNEESIKMKVAFRSDAYTAAVDALAAANPGLSRTDLHTAMNEMDALVMVVCTACPSVIPEGERYAGGDPVDGDKVHLAADSYGPILDMNGPKDADGHPLLGFETTMRRATVRLASEWRGLETTVFVHELGHVLFQIGDMYKKDHHRPDLRYLVHLDPMDSSTHLPHLCSRNQIFCGFVVDDQAPARAEANQVGFVPGPAEWAADAVEGAETVFRALLVPLERWTANTKARVREAMGDNLPVLAALRLPIASDHGAVVMVEARQSGATFSQALGGLAAGDAADAGLLVSNVLLPLSNRGWFPEYGPAAFRGAAHLLAGPADIRSAGDVFDLANAPGLPLAGVTVEVRSVRRLGSTTAVFEVVVRRREAPRVDLHFDRAQGAPEFLSPDIWVDWPGNNGDADEPYLGHPRGTPLDQGEAVRVPPPGAPPEDHFVVARVHNSGGAAAVDVTVTFSVSDPAGSGSDFTWPITHSAQIDRVAAGGVGHAVWRWAVPPGGGGHRCIRAQIFDWRPEEGGGDDVTAVDITAQQNLFEFHELVSASPYAPVRFVHRVHNGANEAREAYLVPSRLPNGVHLRVWPRFQTVAPDGHGDFHCELRLDVKTLPPGGAPDPWFDLSAFRVAGAGEHSDVPWGGCRYVARPRLKTSLTAECRWPDAADEGEFLEVSGRFACLAALYERRGDEDDRVEVRVRAAVMAAGSAAAGRGSTVVWKTAAIGTARGTWSVRFTNAELGVHDPSAPALAVCHAEFGGTSILARCRSGATRTKLGSHS